MTFCFYFFCCHQRRAQERFSQVTLESGTFSQVTLDFSHGEVDKIAQIRAIWTILFSSYAGIHNQPCMFHLM